VKSTHSSLYGHVLAGLRSHRKAKGITQEELANRLRNRQTFVSKVERGERRIDVAEFVEIARAMDGDPVALLRDLLKTFDSGTSKRSKPRLDKR